MGRTIGQTIHPSWNYDLDSSLRVHRMLASRALNKEWRFENRWVTTGPFETLMGYSNCGSSLGSTSWCALSLFFRDGLSEMVRRLNKNILHALCDYPGFASLDEEIPNRSFTHAGEAVDSLLKYESGRTKQVMNQHHKKATLVRNVRLDCTDSGVYLKADVTFNTKPTESSWGLWWLAEKTSPKWQERMKIGTWLTKAEKSIAELVVPRRETTT